MLFTEERFEAFARQAETMIQAGRKWVDADEVGAALGMTPHESRLLVEHLESAGWATLLEGNEASVVKFKLTLQGFREIAKLRWPKWKRWIDKHEKLLTFVAGIVCTIAGALAIKFLDRTFWPVP